jgi:hypothetical protein
LFNGFGQVHLLLPVEENAGLVTYTIFVHGTGPEYQVPDPKRGGYVNIEIEIDKNPLIDELNGDDNPLIDESNDDVVPPTEIQPWIKTSVGYWADGVTSDAEFINAIQFLIKEGIIQIPPTTQGTGDAAEIQPWIKTSVGYWADGVTSDAEFVNAIQFLIKEGIIIISS